MAVWYYIIYYVLCDCTSSNETYQVCRWLFQRIMTSHTKITCLVLLSGTTKTKKTEEIPIPLSLNSKNKVVLQILSTTIQQFWRMPSGTVFLVTAQVILAPEDLFHPVQHHNARFHHIYPSLFIESFHIKHTVWRAEQILLLPFRL